MTVFRIGVFILACGALHWAYGSLRSGPLEPWFIHALTVQPSASAIAWLWPTDGVVAAGPRLTWPSGRLTLLAGCDGFEVMSLFVAATLAADVAWRRRAIALVAGCLAVWALNQTRIVALYWAFRYERAWFDPLHSVWGPLLMVAAVAAMFVWVVRGGASPSSAGPRSESPTCH